MPGGVTGKACEGIPMSILLGSLTRYEPPTYANELELESSDIGECRMPGSVGCEHRYSQPFQRVLGGAK